MAPRLTPEERRERLLTVIAAIVSIALLLALPHL